MRRLLAALAVAAVLGVAAYLVVMRFTSPAPDTVPRSPVAGVVVRVDSSGLNAVRGFTLRTSGGQQLQFDLSRLQNGVEFPPGHLAEHAATAAPIRVDFVGEAGLLYAIHIQDAPSG